MDQLSSTVLSMLNVMIVAQMSIFATARHEETVSYSSPRRFESHHRAYTRAIARLCPGYPEW
jgi:hypothetical protein